MLYLLSFSNTTSIWYRFWYLIITIQCCKTYDIYLYIYARNYILTDISVLISRIVHVLSILNTLNSLFGGHLDIKTIINKMGKIFAEKKTIYQLKQTTLYLVSIHVMNKKGKMKMQKLNDSEKLVHGRLFLTVCLNIAM